MTSILLCINDATICQQLMTNIAWNELQLRFTGCVSDKQDVWECIERLKPNIILLSNSACTVSEQELMQYIEASGEEIGIVVCSPEDAANPRQLNQMLSRQIVVKTQGNECEIEQLQLGRFLEECKSQLREKLLQDLTYGMLLDDAELSQKCSFLNMDKEMKYYVVCAEIDNLKEKFCTLQEEKKVFVTMYLSKALSTTLPNATETTLFPIAKGRYAILIPNYATEDIVSTCDNIRKLFRTYTDLSATFGIGGPPMDMLHLQEAYVKAYETLIYKYLSGNNIVICYEDIQSTEAENISHVNTMATQMQIIKATRTGDSEQIYPLCEKWFEALESCTPTLIKSLIIQFVGNLSVELLKTGTSLTELFGDENLLVEKVLRFDTIFDVKLWLSQILKYISEYMREKKQKNTYLLAKRAVQYIDQHYMENINVDSIANAVYLSPGYLMTIFKKEIGVSVIVYLTNRRIEKAKELLKENHMKICDIAEAVGYSNATFFSSTFHKHVGKSPKKFREHYVNMVEILSDEKDMAKGEEKEND